MPFLLVVFLLAKTVLAFFGQKKSELFGGTFATEESIWVNISDKFSNDLLDNLNSNNVSKSASLSFARALWVFDNVKIDFCSNVV